MELNPEHTHKHSDYNKTEEQNIASYENQARRDICAIFNTYQYLIKNN